MRQSSSGIVIASCATLLLAVASAVADPVAVDLYVDSAPNRYGSPNWAPWWSAAKTDVVGGTFTDLRTGTFPGTHIIHPSDEIVYSYGDLGKRIHWIYWIDGATKEGLEGLFEVKMVMDWESVDYTYDWSQPGSPLVPDAPEVGWVQPGSWENYSSGVIGSFGHAWWAVLPQTPEQLAAEVFQYQTYLKGMVRIRQTVESPWVVQDLNLTMIPLPAPIGLAGVGLLSIGGFASWKRRARG